MGLLPSEMDCVFALSELLALSTAVGEHERAPKELRYESGELLRPIEKLIAVLSSICVVKPTAVRTTPPHTTFFSHPTTAPAPP